ncbi:helix-turn-helix transcriptional regulator [Colwellia piezophila]|uniref:helix-turn-helix transcriptional regulator n=1 Tax=Colwellia piezophila TaxID=211668 RepID=UPI00036967AF|nr:AlpA family phage regulatory protein [Colwellia piezophila]
MNNKLLTPPTDRLIREPERKRLTSVCRTGAWELEQKGQFPKRRRLHPSGSTVCWLLSEINLWINEREVVNPS